MSYREMTCGQGIVVWVLAFGTSLGACGEAKKSLSIPGGGSGGAGAQGNDASASGGASANGGSSEQAGSRGMGGGGGAVGGAGGADKAISPYFRAGSRLKPRTFGSGALKILEGTAEQSWVDAETGIACSFRVGADGMERCLPAAGDGAYADAQCTTPVLIGPAPGA